jgi:hypothetical protein
MQTVIHGAEAENRIVRPQRFADVALRIPGGMG